MQPLTPVVLSGEHVRLEPAQPRHADALWATVDEQAWRFMTLRAQSPRELAAWLADNAELAARGVSQGFVQCALPSGMVVGHTGFWNVAGEHGRVEIGFTWLAPHYRRTAVNTEAKLLLLHHAFTALGCRRVEFKTDARNAPARAALRRCGAVEEGTLRAHMLLPDGSSRDSVYYSVLAPEWPAVAQRLRALLAAPRP